MQLQLRWTLAFLKTSVGKTSKVKKKEERRHAPMRDSPHKIRTLSILILSASSQQCDWCPQLSRVVPPRCLRCRTSPTKGAAKLRPRGWRELSRADRTTPSSARPPRRRGLWNSSGVPEPAEEISPFDDAVTIAAASVWEVPGEGVR